MNAFFTGEKIVTAREMARVEGEAFTRGESAEKFMNQAGLAIAALVEEFIHSHQLERRVTLLAGKGNNAGDGYTVAIELLNRGFIVEAIHLYSFTLCGPLCREKAEKFKAAGGTIHLIHQEHPIALQKSGVILDGLVGTGFHGKPEDLMASIISKANESGLPIIAIDIPSGLNGDTGQVESVAIRAAMTIYLGLPKLGFFLGNGFDYVGVLKKADFGLSSKDIESAKASGILYDKEKWSELLPRISRTQHKYERGYVVVWAGSLGMPGAAILSCMGAFRAGAGIVRLFYDKEMQDQLGSAPSELIKEPLDDVRRFCSEAERAGCVVIGPGLGRESRTGNTLGKILSQIKCPAVLDADALYFLAQDSMKLPEETILTPHRGELLQLLGENADIEGENFLNITQNYAQEHRVVILCKGAPTILFHPDRKPLFLPVGDAGMATAGSGDVLSGILGALLAAKMPILDAAIAAVCLHGKAGEIAAKEKTSRSVIASDLIEALPKVYLSLTEDSSF